MTYTGLNQALSALSYPKFILVYFVFFTRATLIIHYMKCNQIWIWPGSKNLAQFR